MKQHKGGRKPLPPPIQWQVGQLRTQIGGLQTDIGLLTVMLETVLSEKDLPERATKDGCVVLTGIHFDINEKKFYKTSPKQTQTTADL